MVEDSTVEEPLTSNSKHPHFPNPTIQEALCDIRFKLPEEKKWDPEIFAKFYEAIRADFPTFEPAVMAGIQTQLGGGVFEQSLLPPLQMMRYKHMNEKKIFAQLTSEFISINILPKYPGWEVMESEILKIWSKAYSVISPEKITRLEVRFINRIERDSPNEKISEWIQSSDYVPKAVLNTPSQFALFVEFPGDSGIRVRVIVSELLHEKTRPVMLDIDCFTMQILKPNGENLKSHINLLHDKIWDVFEASTSEKLKKRLLEIPQ